jgi:NADPH:quinone reductase-like Zn-dependent oxidoreductase
VIDRVLPLADIAEAQRHLATRRARGKVVVRVA